MYNSGILASNFTYILGNENEITSLSVQTNYIFHCRNEPLKQDDVLAVVSSDGSIVWIVPVEAKVDCFEERKVQTTNCTFKFGSWTRDGFSMDVQPYNGDATPDVTDYIRRRGLELVDHYGYRNVTYYACCKEPYISMFYVLRFKKQMIEHRN